MLTSHERRLGRELVRAGVLSESRLAEAAQQRDADDDRTLREILLESDDLTEEDFLDFFANRYRLERYPSVVDAVMADAISLVPRALCEELDVVPLSVADGSLLVAIVDPLSYIPVQDALEELTGLRVQMVLAPAAEVAAALAIYYGPAEEIGEPVAAEPAARGDLGAPDTEMPLDVDEDVDEDIDADVDADIAEDLEWLDPDVEDAPDPDGDVPEPEAMEPLEALKALKALEQHDPSAAPITSPERAEPGAGDESDETRVPDAGNATAPADGDAAALVSEADPALSAPQAEASAPDAEPQPADERPAEVDDVEAWLQALKAERAAAAEALASGATPPERVAEPGADGAASTAAIDATDAIDARDARDAIDAREVDDPSAEAQPTDDRPSDAAWAGDTQSSDAQADATQADATQADATQADTTQADATVPADSQAGGAESATELPDPPLSRPLTDLVRRALLRQASDILLERTADAVMVRLRVDGVLEPALPLPVSSMGALQSQGVPESSTPFAVRVRVDDDVVELIARVTPTRAGEHWRLRFAEPAGEPEDLATAGFDEQALAWLRQVVAGGQGLVLVVGPRDSGKRTTVQAALAELADPCWDMLSLDTRQARPSASLTTWARERIRLESPDVVVVGSLADADRVALATDVAAHGRLVLGTLERRGAAQALTRLLELGVPARALATALRVVISQRLVRRICGDCRIPDPDAEAHPRPYGILRRLLHVGVGCEACGWTGFRGRMLIAEVAPVDKGLRDALLRQASADELDVLLQGQDGESLAGRVRQLVRAGETSLDEALRIVPELAESPGSGRSSASAKSLRASGTTRTSRKRPSSGKRPRKKATGKAAPKQARRKPSTRKAVVRKKTTRQKPARKAATRKKPALKSAKRKKAALKAATRKTATRKTAVRKKAIRKKATRKKATRKKATRKKATRKKATRKKATRKKATRKKATRKTATRKKATRKKATRKKAARKTATRKKATRKTAARKTATRKTATRKTATRKKATRKKATRKKATRKKATRKKATRKKAARKTATRKKATRKKATRKTATRKTATRKKATRKKATRKKATRKKATRKKATRKKATRKTATRKKATRKKATRKKATRKKATRKQPNRRRGVRRAADCKPATRKKATRKTATRKTATRKTATRKTATRKTATRKTATRKTATRKTPNRRKRVRRAAPRRAARRRVRRR